MKPAEAKQRLSKLREDINRVTGELNKLQIKQYEEEAGFREIDELLRKTQEWHAAVNNYNGFVSMLTKDFADEKQAILDRMRSKFTNADPIVFEIDSHIAGGLTFEQIKECLDTSDNIATFLRCVDGKKYL